MSPRITGFAPIFLTAPLWLQLACASTVQEPGVPRSVEAGESSCHPTQSAAESPASLPRYFTLQLSPEQLQNGEVTADGDTLHETELAARLTREAQSDAAQGAALVVAPGVANKDVLRIFRELRAAGFSHVLVSGAQSPMRQEQGAVIEPPPAASDEQTLEAPAQATSVEAAPDGSEPAAPPADVLVKNLGLHIGGGPNSTANRERYSAPIESRFDDFRRCHLFADERRRNASFGVDLLVSTTGGRAKIKDYRTSLKGKDFHLCVLGVFGEIEFPAPPRPTVISYSLLFKKP